MGKSKSANYSGKAFTALFITFSIIMLVSRFNFLTVIAVALSIGISIIILVSYIFRQKVEPCMFISHATLILSVFIFYVLWGADKFWDRFIYNFLLAAVPLSLLFLIYVFIRRDFIRLKKTLLAMSMIFLILGSTLYMLVMSIRARPTSASLKKGHDEYLNMINNLVKVDESSPNVLVILMDDMAYSDLSCYSYLGRENATIKTPVIDALADDGVMFENFYSCSPVCSPSRFGMLTGRYASRGHLDNVVFPTAVSLKPFGDTRMLNPFQFSNNVDGILGDEITFAEVMQSMGYNTGLFGKWNLGDYGEYLPTNQGFDYFFGSYYVNDMTPYNFVREKDGIGKEVMSHYELVDQSETTKILTEEISNYITKSIEKNEKFLAYYATPWPHYPIFSGEKYNPQDDNYIDCIQEFDEYLGHIVELLKENDVYDDTLIIFTSDNGPGREGVTGALRGRKGTTFDGGQKVPFIATYTNGGIGKGANFEDSNIISSHTMNIDIFPTILKYIGVEKLPQDRVIDGVSMYDLLQGKINPDASVHDIIFHIHRGEVQGVQMPKVIDGEEYQFKYYKSVWTENTAFFNQFYNNYLFNLTTDPAEGYNVSMVHPDIANDMNQKLSDFKKELKENRRGKI